MSAEGIFWATCAIVMIVVILLILFNEDIAQCFCPMPFQPYVATYKVVGLVVKKDKPASVV